MPDGNEDLITPADAARLIHLRFSKESRDKVAFWRAIHDWGVPHYRMGPRTIMFSRRDVIAWLESRRVGKAAA